LTLPGITTKQYRKCADPRGSRCLRKAEQKPLNTVAVLGNTSKSNQAGTLSYLDPHIRDAPTKYNRACGCTCAAATVEKGQERERHKPGTCQSLAWWAGSIGLPRMPTSADRKLPMTPGLGNIKSQLVFSMNMQF